MGKIRMVRLELFDEQWVLDLEKDVAGERGTYRNENWTQQIYLNAHQVRRIRNEGAAGRRLRLNGAAPSPLKPGQLKYAVRLRVQL